MNDGTSADDMSKDVLLSLNGIEKRYGGVRAIRNADMEIACGEVHALVGENGAGKSTVIKIVSGAEYPDAGIIEYAGEVVEIRSPSQALEMGIATVYQETQLFSELTVEENVFVGRELGRGGKIDWDAQNQEVRVLLERLDLPPEYATRKVGTLSAAQQQLVSIAKALSHSARLLILDEPSAILTDAEIQILFRIVRKLASEGVSIIYITHRLDELVQIADRVTVMRDGNTVGTFPIPGLKVRDIVEMMVGGEFAETTRVPGSVGDQSKLQLDKICSGSAFRDVTLEVRDGEIVVLYGLVGSGANEVTAAVYGMQNIDSGRILIDGTPVSITSSTKARKSGVTLLPANRKLEGLFSFQSIAFNITIGNLDLFEGPGTWVNTKKETAESRSMIKRLSIKAPNENVHVATLSGGNAQKVVLARQLVERPEILLLAEPTQGVDIGAKEEIHKLVTGLADQGTAILTSTTDLGEAIRIADRIIVMRDGKPFAEFGSGATRAEVLAAAVGDESKSTEGR